MYPLTNPQKLIYNMEQYVGGPIAVICGSILVDGEIAPSRLTDAIREIFRLNDVLRTRIVERDGMVCQQVVPYEPCAIDVLHFDSETQLHSYAEFCAKEPISLSGKLCDIQAVFLPNRFGFIVKCHHIIGDAWTLTLICSQFNAILAGEQPPAFPYSDYVESESAYLQSSRCAKDRAFFMEQFKTCDDVTYLADQNSSSYAAERITFSVSTTQTTPIRSYAKQHNASPFVLFLTAVAVYFSRVKMNAERFYIGTPLLNRGTFKEKNTMGMFINTVPVLANVDYTHTFADNLAAMQREAFSVLRHQKFHYNDLLTAIRQEFGFTEQLYDVVLSYQNAVVHGAASKVETTWYHNGLQTESLQIHIDDRDGENAFRIHLDYRTDKFTSAEIERMYTHILNLLLDAITNDSKKPGELELLPADEKQQLLLTFNDTAADYPRDKCVHQLFEEQVEKNPEKTAVIACDRILTYWELNEEANRIAHGLIDQGVKPGDIVAFALPRNSHLIPAMFGILKTGAAYLPIDLDYPQERVSYMLEDSGASFFITGDNIGTLLRNECRENPCVPLSSESLCYCIYTSGTTGNPKGVLIRHRNLVNFCHKSTRNTYQMAVTNKNAVVLSTFKQSFDAFEGDSVLPLLNECSLILVTDKDALDGKKLKELAEKYNANILQTTPSVIQSLCLELEYREILRQIRVILLAAESISPDLPDYLRKFTDATIFNGYGPSETTIGASYTEVKTNDITIGRPTANTKIYIVDKYLNPVPIGVTGELCIAGDGVGAGYLNRPELTAEKFIVNPFREGKLYKTGDLAYWREDGNIAYVGRNDFQVKIRGLRIELGEIENAIAGVNGVSQAVVVVRKDENGRQLICAFYTETNPVELDTIRTALREKLPRYMMPHIFTRLDALPMTTSGKANRKALPDVDLSIITSEVEYVDPATREEIVLTDAVAEVLHIEKAGMLNNFFTMGGDSLKAIELTAALERQGYQVSVKAIFAADTLGELAAQLEPSVVEADIEVPAGDIPATDAQMRVYTAHSVSGGTAYNVPYAFRVKGLDPLRLQAAVNQMVSRHEILRTRFENQAGIIMQVVDDKASCKVESLPSDDLLAFIRPFDLDTTPLLRVGYHRDTVMLDMHHIITDGGSMPTFLRELNEFYMDRDVPEPPVQYRAFAAQKNDLTESEQYWFSVFDDEPPVLELNTDYPRGNRQTFSGSALYETISANLHTRICAKCQQLGITPYAFYMGAFHILLSKFGGGEDIVVGTPASGRDGKFLNTLGMFVNTLALRSHPEGDKTVAVFLREMKDTIVGALENQTYPYGELVKKLGLQGGNRNPLFDVVFAYQSEEMTQVVFGDEAAELLPIPITTSKYDFTFHVMPRSGDVVLMAEYCTDLYKEQTIKRLVTGYELLLAQMLDAEKSLNTLTAMSEAERRTLLLDFNDTATDYPRDKCVHTLFEEQVERTPDKTAVIACDRTLTYRELNEDANQIAHGLIDQGVKPGDIVAFALLRNSQLISTMFGILKAGAAYLPIDPDYPQERISYMLEDSRAKFFVDTNNISVLLKSKRCKNPCVFLSANNPCYCIYTSGSTGNPKGVIIRHRNFVNFCNTKASIYHEKLFNAKGAVLSTFRACFDGFGVDSILPTLFGKTIALPNEQYLTDADLLSDFAVQSGCAVIQGTPTTLKAFCVSDAFRKFLYSSELLLFAAESFTPTDCLYFQALTGATIINGYGPTETTIGASFGEVMPENITIGHPIANTQIYIVDKYLNPVPIGVTGELCIAGDGVGAGYLNRPELTAEKFIGNPFGEGKLYKTGDLAYWREDGNIVYVGRNDFQVKIRGLRIELGEIENAIARVDGVSQAVVIVRKDDTGRQLICAFYTETDPVELDAIKTALREKLPRYMMPHIFTRPDTLPMTTSGKVNRKALPDVDLSAIQNDTEFVSPDGKREKVLASIIEQVLGYSPVGREDNFFDLGGDSLKAIEFVSKAHTDGIYFSLQNVFDYPTVKSLCQYIDSGDKAIVSFESIDFTQINGLLAENCLENAAIPSETDVGDILLAGATGFLGIHVLDNYLEYDGGIAYCLVRGRNQADSEKRLAELLKFYFGEKYSIGGRIQVVCGDLQKETFGLTEVAYQELRGKVDTVINAAASVKHYGSYRYFYETNVESTQHLINFCASADIKLIHISTLSVSGNSFGDQFDGYVSETEKHFYESDLYIGQPLENVYARSKFEAEKLVIEAMANGLPANIMRMGNLTNRLSDGVFQINHETNAAAQRIKGILELGMVPDYLIAEDMYVEFTPIDEAAQAIMTIVRHFSTKQTVFHINSTKVVYLDQLVELFCELGCPLKGVSGVDFTVALRKTAKQAGLEHIFETFINDLDKNDRLNYDSNIRIENGFTEEYLRRLGFTWSEIGIEYLRKYVAYFRKIGYWGV